MIANTNSSTDLAIYKGALLDDWDSVSQIFEQHPDLMTKQIKCYLETPLVIAIGSNSSHRFVYKLVERIVAIGAKDRLFVTSYDGNNPLHFAARVGNTTAARVLVEQDSDMTRVVNLDGHTPLKLAAWYGNKETLKYLLTVTPGLLPGDEGSSPYTGVDGGDLLGLTIMAGFYDVALQIIDSRPNIVLENDRNGQTALQILALKPELFPSGTSLGFWKRFIYSLMPMKKSQGTTQVKILFRIFIMFTAGFWSALQYIDPTIQSIHYTKVNDNLSSLLVKRICKIVIAKVDSEVAWKILGSAITTAINYGAHELIEECILTYPGIIWYSDGGFHLFTEAIKQRQERVYNLLSQISRHRVLVSSHTVDQENILHIAAKLAPPHRLNVVTGAASQMQLEIQWYKEVEKVTEPSFRVALNKNGQTPRMVFSDAHKELCKEGQEWMKNTASSCTVVAALLVTMAFAAVFTVPGGTQDDGKPSFVNKKTFMLFVVSDAIALFSSTTSVLMFLGILTSGMAEGDFLYILPKRLTIGLLSLFISLAATMIAFSSVLALVLQGKVTWIAAPLVLATSIPVYLFGLLQLPLLVELFKSTYGRSIFRQRSAGRLHKLLFSEHQITNN